MRAVLFDATGTLIRLRERVGESYARLARPFGVRLSPQRIEDAFQRVMPQMPGMVFPGEAAEAVEALERAWWRELVRRTFRAADGSAQFSDFAAYFDALFQHFAQPAAWQPMPGAAVAVARLQASGLRLGVVSNFDHRLAGLLAAFDLASPFAVVVRPADAGAAKPDPRIFAHALAALNVAAAEAVYVGDDADPDVAGAARAGLRAIDVRALASLAELPDLITRIDQES